VVKVKRFNFIAVVSVLLLSLWQPGPVISQQEAVYNLASIQPDKRIEIEADGHGTGLLYFYNVDGNCPTHIKLEISSSPENWEVEIQPSPQRTLIDTANGSISLIENLCVEPSALQPEKITALPDGLECVAVPGRGYAVAKVVCITIWVPESKKAADGGEVVVTVEANWLGQGGAASIGQTREFVFSVELLDAGSDATVERENKENKVAFIMEKQPLVITAGLALLLAVGLFNVVKSNKID
jgi:hypothetical protein